MLNENQSIHRPIKSRRMSYFVCLFGLLLLWGTTSGLEDESGPNKEPLGKQRQSSARERQDSNHRQSSQVQNSSQNDMALPPQPTVSLLSSTSARVSWSLPPSSGLPIVFIKIQYRELNSRRKNLPVLWNTVEDDIPPSTTSYVVKKLKTGATYHFRLAAVYSNSDNRHGPNSERFLVEAPDKSKPPAFGPIIVELKAVSPNALSVSWQMAETQLPVSGFVVQYQVYSDAKAQGQRADQRRHTAEKEGDVFEEIKISNPKKKSAFIKGLQPSTPYTVRMFSYNKDGKSALSNSAVASTLPGRKSKESSAFPNDYQEPEEMPTRLDGVAQPHQGSPEHRESSGLDRFPAGNRSHEEVSDSSDDLKETVDLLRNERMLLIIACSVLSCFLIIMSLCFLLFICLRDKFVFVVPFSKKVYSHPRVTDREVRTF